MNILHNQDLSKLNTLHLQAIAANYIALQTEAQLPEIATIIQNYNRYFILGGGSNIILPELYSGLVIHNQLCGKTITDIGEYYMVTAKAGEIWDDFVAWCLENGAYGLENLSLIPGTVGASPVQNIGAYGVEVKDFIDHIKVYDLKTNELIQLSNVDCQFSYRNSILKSIPNYLVLEVSFRLPKVSPLNCNYGDVKEKLASIPAPSAHDLRNCIIQTRQAKLPDHAEIGNAGSFFHNPIIDRAMAEQLKTQYPNLPIYPTGDKDKIKVSAGWLIDNLGLKGYRMGNVGVYAKQALVLVNHAKASKQELLALAEYIQTAVLDKYNITINIEPIQIR